MKKVLSVRQREAGLLARRPRPARAIVSAVRRPSRVPVRRLQLRLLLVVDEIAAFVLQLREERVVDRGVDEQVAVGGAAGAVVVGLADARVARRLLDVGGLVDDHRRVAGADAVGRLARSVRRLDHRRAAGRDRQIAAAPSARCASGMLGRSTHLQHVLGRALLAAAPRA